MVPDEDELDHTQIHSLRELDGPGQETLRELAGLFNASSTDALPVMRNALVRGDLQTLKRTAHSLKGSSASLGASHVAKLCASIEKTAVEQRLGELPELLDQLAERISRANAALAAVLNQPA